MSKGFGRVATSVAVHGICKASGRGHNVLALAMLAIFAIGPFALFLVVSLGVTALMQYWWAIALAAGLVYLLCKASVENKLTGLHMIKTSSVHSTNYHWWVKEPFQDPRSVTFEWVKQNYTYAQCVEMQAKHYEQMPEHYSPIPKF